MSEDAKLPAGAPGLPTMDTTNASATVLGASILGSAAAFLGIPAAVAEFVKSLGLSSFMLIVALIIAAIVGAIVGAVGAAANGARLVAGVVSAMDTSSARVTAAANLGPSAVAITAAPTPATTRHASATRPPWAKWPARA